MVSATASFPLIFAFRRAGIASKSRLNSLESRLNSRLKVAKISCNNESEQSNSADRVHAAANVLCELHHGGLFATENRQKVGYIGVMDYIEFTLTISLEEMLDMCKVVCDYEEGDKVYGKLASNGLFEEGLMRLKTTEDVCAILERREMNEIMSLYIVKKNLPSDKHEVPDEQFEVPLPNSGDGSTGEEWEPTSTDEDIV